MSPTFTFRASVASAVAQAGQLTDAMPEILIGRTDGPVAQAFFGRVVRSAIDGRRP